MPFKANRDRRHHIPKQQHRVTNWAAYDAGLRARGSLTVWFTAEAIEAWRAEPRTGRGGQPRYSSLAITTALTLRAVFRLALRQTEGLVGSILQLLGLDLAVPDHSTLSRRAETLEVPRPKAGSEPVHLLVDSTGLRLCGPGEWLTEKALSTWWATRRTPSRGSTALSVTPPLGRTSPVATLGRLRCGRADIERQSSGAAADGSGRRSWRGMTGSAAPAPAT